MIKQDNIVIKNTQAEQQTGRWRELIREMWGMRVKKLINLT